MKIFNCPLKLQNFILSENKKIGFVPTMGNLHDGHLELCKKCIDENDLSIVSIYVNQTQFNNQSDFNNYPITFDDDVSKLEKIGIDIVFAPTFDNMYPDGFDTKISCNNDVSKILEGKYRKNHFNGMLSVVMKLLNITRPYNAYFGEKDFQQIYFIKRMVKAYFLPINIIGCPIVRDEHMLPLSSRNNRLNKKQLQIAQNVATTFHNYDDIETLKQKLKKYDIKVEYIESFENHLHIAYFIGEIRLIDNKKL